MVNSNLFEVDILKAQTKLEDAPEVLRRVAQYIDPASMVQRIWDCRAEIIAQQAGIMNVKDQAVLPPQGYHTEFESLIRILTNNCNEDR
jgi:hypothetical protein